MRTGPERESVRNENQPRVAQMPKYSRSNSFMLVDEGVKSSSNATLKGVVYCNLIVLVGVNNTLPHYCNGLELKSQ